MQALDARKTLSAQIVDKAQVKSEINHWLETEVALSCDEMDAHPEKGLSASNIRDFIAKLPG